MNREEIANRRAKWIERARQDFSNLCTELGYDEELLKGTRRDKQIVDQRINIAKRLYIYGYSTPIIGEIMKKDHTTIVFMVNDKYREKRKTEMREKARLNHAKTAEQNG